MKEVYFEGGPVDDELRAAIGYETICIYVTEPVEPPERVILGVPPRPTVQSHTRCALYRRVRFAPESGARLAYNRTHPKASRANIVAQFVGWEDGPDTPTNGGSTNE